MNYVDSCRQASIDQGLGAFLDAEGWTVEQTGGFTMVAFGRLANGGLWTVSHDGDGYLACLTTLDAWENSEEPSDDAYRGPLSLADALALVKS